MIATQNNALATSPTFLLRRALLSLDSNSKQLTNKRPTTSVSDDDDLTVSFR